MAAAFPGRCLLTPPADKPAAGRPEDSCWEVLQGVGEPAQSGQRSLTPSSATTACSPPPSTPSTSTGALRPFGEG